MADKRICRKCLLAELDNEKLLAEVRQAIDRLGADLKVSDETYAKRLDICRSCDYLNDGTCGACGCYVELRAAAKTGKCPYKKWTV
ncbi:MAG: hypothetical protein J5367_08800 [Lachnospiraceae bacterium]|nr:hypothetical protein [Lachnospiraceae bacterium]